MRMFSYISHCKVFAQINAALLRTAVVPSSPSLSTFATKLRQCFLREAVAVRAAAAAAEVAAAVEGEAVAARMPRGLPRVAVGAVGGEAPPAAEAEAGPGGGGTCRLCLRR